MICFGRNKSWKQNQNGFKMATFQVSHFLAWAVPLIIEVYGHSSSRESRRLLVELSQLSYTLLKVFQQRPRFW